MRIRSILSGAAANLYGQAVTIGTQLVSVPILIAAWGLEGFGLWTMLVTVPTLLLTMDFGYSAAAAGMMSKAIAKGDESDALVSLQSAFAVISAITATLVAGAALLLWHASTTTFVAQGGMTAAEAQELMQALPLMVFYVAITLPSGLAYAVYRVNNHYTLGVMVYETARLIEQSMVMTIALRGGDIQMAAMGLIATRLFFTAVYSGVMLRVTPWVKVSFAHVSRARLREMLEPALAAMFMPLCVFAGIQGVTLVVGVFLAPAAAGSFATIRVLFRTVVQVVGTFTRASVPEFALTFARDDLAAKQRIARFTSGILFAGATLGSVAVLVAGPAFVDVWTGGKVILPFYIYAIMVTHAFFGCLWNGMSNLIMGMNLQARYVPQLILWNLIGVATLFVAVPHFGLAGAALCIAAIDTLSFASVFRVWMEITPRSKLRSSDYSKMSNAELVSKDS
jgi:O-antigen/teichoic acid export membrane protein